MYASGLVLGVCVDLRVFHREILTEVLAAQSQLCASRIEASIHAWLGLHLLCAALERKPLQAYPTMRKT